MHVLLATNSQGTCRCLKKEKRQSKNLPTQFGTQGVTLLYKRALPICTVHTEKQYLERAAVARQAYETDAFCSRIENT